MSHDLPLQQFLHLKLEIRR